MHIDCVCVCVCVCEYTYAHICVYVHVHTYMCSICMVFFVFLFCVLNNSLKIFFHCPKIALLKSNMHMNYTGNLLNC